MNGQPALTKPQIDFTNPAAPRALGAGDVFWSPYISPLAESRQVFIEGCGLATRLSETSNTTIVELGYGSSLNALQVWQCWRAQGRRSHVTFVGIERAPWSRWQMQRFFDAIEIPAAMASNWIGQQPDRWAGWHFVPVEPGFSLLLGYADARWCLRQLDAKAGVHCWLLDGFAPDRNQSLWSEDIWRQIERLSAPDATAASFSVARVVRDGLASAGFDCQCVPGPGNKREVLRATKAQAQQTSTPQVSTVAIIGAGVAGAALTRAFRRRGVDVALFDAQGAFAQSPPVAMICPPFPTTCAAATSLMPAAFSLAKRWPIGRVSQRGVLQVPKNLERRQQALSTWQVSRSQARVLSAARVAAATAGFLTTPAIFWRDGLCVEPPGDGLDVAVKPIDAPAFEQLQHDYDRVIIATANAGWWQDVWRTEPCRGVLASFGDQLQQRAIAGPSLLARNRRGETFSGSTFAVGDGSFAAATLTETNQCRLQLETLVAQSLPATVGAWAGVRYSTRTRLPAVGTLTNSVAVLLGLRSHGFTLAPLLAEHLASKVMGGPGLVALDIASQLNPRRHQALKQADF